MKYEDKRTNLATAAIVNQGIGWRETYGARSAAAFMAHRAIPRNVILRVINSSDIRGAQQRTRTQRAAIIASINQAEK